MILWPNELDPENALQLLEVVALLELLLSVLEVVVPILLSVLEVAPTDCVSCADWPDEPQPASRILN